MTLKRPKKTKNSVINLENPTTKQFTEFVESISSVRTEYPKSPWELQYDPRFGNTDVTVIYKSEIVGRIQRASVSFDVDNTIPKLTLEILVPGLVISSPQEKSKV